MWPTNSTGLSFAAVLKWILIIVSIPCLIGAYQGIVQKQANVTRTELVTGPAAVQQGLKNLLFAAILLAASWAVWYFWQRNED